MIARLFAVLTFTATLLEPARLVVAAETYDILLRGGHIVDGAGNPWFKADLGIRGDRIAAIGDLKDARASSTLDVRDLIVAPGFIDMLGQSEYTVLADPHLRSKITQGITTELTGEGGSVTPMTDYLTGELKPVTLGRLEAGLPRLPDVGEGAWRAAGGGGGSHQ